MPGDLTQEIIAAAIKIHRKPGPGLLQSSHEACLAEEPEKPGLRVERQKPVPIIYESVKMDCGFRADIVVEGKVVVELKCKDVLSPRRQGSAFVPPPAARCSSWFFDQHPCCFSMLFFREGTKLMVNNYREPAGESL